MRHTATRWLALRPSTWFYVLVAFVATAPAWIVKHPPLEDLPLHLATIRTLKSIHDPAFGIDKDLVLTLGRTQYVVYYVLGAAIATVTGVVGANVVLLVGLPRRHRARAARSPSRSRRATSAFASWSIPLLVNEMFLYGLFPFLLGIPVMLWALATSVRHFERPRCEAERSSRRSPLVTLLFARLPVRHLRHRIRGDVPVDEALARGSRAPLLLVPAVAVLAWWTFFTAAGRLVSGATEGFESAPQPGSGNRRPAQLVHQRVPRRQQRQSSSSRSP